jgi:hypothetical protein
MAPTLTILNKSDALECAHDFPSSQRWKLGHESSGDGHGDGDPSLKRVSLLGDRFPVSCQALQIQRNRLFDVALGFFQSLTLRVATRQGRHQGHVAPLWGLFVKDRVGEFPGSLARHVFIVEAFAGTGKASPGPNRSASASAGYEADAKPNFGDFAGVR